MRALHQLYAIVVPDHLELLRSQVNVITDSAFAQASSIVAEIGHGIQRALARFALVLLNGTALGEKRGVLISSKVAVAAAL